ncbi:MAG: hypothetical protein ACRCTX_26540 [Afipia sp.]
MNHYDPTDLQAQADAEREQNERAKRAREQEIDDLKWQMSDKRGRRLAFSLLERAGVYRASFSTDALQMAHNEGRRVEGMRMDWMLKTYCPDRYAEMLKENQSK